MKIAITGSNGFIGKALGQYLKEQGNIILPVRRILLDSLYSRELAHLLSQSDVVINLAGASLNKRWTSAYKKEIYESRIHTTRILVESINTLENKPSLFLSASAVGYYPSRGEYDEEDTLSGEGFLTHVCEAWEKEAKKASPQVRIAITRFGIVLAVSGGAFPKMTFPVRFGISPVLGTGKQYFPWIALKDVLDSMNLIIQTPSCRGVFNLVSPESLTYKQLAGALARKYKTYFTLPIPEIALRLALGEAAGLITNGPLVHPKHLSEYGYTYNYPTIEKFLESL